MTSRFAGTRRLSVELCSLPGEVRDRDISGKSAVAVDVLRAATTITAALANGASRIIPCEEIEQAKSIAAQQTANQHEVLLGGERQGQLIAGFDLDNSPEGYGPEVVGDRTIVFTSTNGTRALAASLAAHRVIMGSFVNLSAVAEALIDNVRPVIIVCAGTNDEPTLEDMLFGGALCQLLGQSMRLRLDPPAQACQAMWETAGRQIAGGASLATILGQCRGGQNLLRLGLERDIEFAAQVDRFSLVPCLNEQAELVPVDHLAGHR
ncbi:MAG: 2-phosphosulfolactate phosphatase [Pirellulaceae bacterium]